MGRGAEEEGVVEGAVLGERVLCPGLEVGAQLDGVIIVNPRCTSVGTAKNVLRFALLQASGRGRSQGRRGVEGSWWRQSARYRR